MLSHLVLWSNIPQRPVFNSPCAAILDFKGRDPQGAELAKEPWLFVSMPRNEAILSY
jgi:hypothetical protein